MKKNEQAPVPEIDLSQIVHAVKNASDKELRVLAQIAASVRDLKTVGLEQTRIINRNQHESLDNPPVKPKLAPVQKPAQEPKQNAKAATKAAAETVDEHRQDRKRSARDRQTKRREKEIDLSQTARVKSEQKATKAAHATAVMTAKQANGVANNAPTKAAAIAAEAQEQGATATKRAMDEFATFWKDEKGRLRRQNGTYASKEEKAKYNDAAAVADQREKEKSQGTIAKLVSTIGSSTRSVMNLGESVFGSDKPADATDAAGATAGGSFYYAAKEIAELAKNTVERIGETKDHISNSKENGFLGKLSLKQFYRRIRREKRLIDKSEGKSAHKKETAATPAKSRLNEVKQIQRQTAQTEAVKEQTEAQKKNIKLILKKLDALTVKAGAASEGGLVDDLLMAGAAGGALKKFFTRNRKPKTTKVTRTRSNPKTKRTPTKAAPKPKTKPTQTKVTPKTKPNAKVPKSLAPRKGMPKVNAPRQPSFWDKFRSPLQKGNNAPSTTKGTPLTRAKGFKVPKMKMGASGGVLAAGFAAWDRYQSVKNDNTLTTAQKTAKVGATAGGAALGTAIGTGIGATLGSFVPVLGTAIGGTLGAVVGGWLGGNLGDMFGDAVSDMMASTESITDKASKTMEAANKAVSDTFSSVAQWLGFGDDDEDAKKKSVAISPEKNSYLTGNVPTNTSYNYAGYQGAKVNNTQAAQIKKEVQERNQRQATTVKIDDKQLEKLSVNVANSKGRETTAPKPTANPNATVKVTQAPASDQTIPSDFLDRDLQRQSADMG